jgi:NADH-quinone oxidoreductase subunit C
MISPERVIKIAPAEIKSTAKELKDKGFDHVKSVAGVDGPEAGIIELVYHISSCLNPALGKQIVVIKTEVNRSEPRIESLCDIFPSCKYMELETRDLLGVRFEGNEEPDPLLLPNELRGAWPLRKDYKIPEEGIELGRKASSGK